MRWLSVIGCTRLGNQKNVIGSTQKQFRVCLCFVPQGKNPRNPYLRVTTAVVALAAAAAAVPFSFKVYAH
jgi:hypothetical protein